MELRRGVVNAYGHFYDSVNFYFIDCNWSRNKFFKWLSTVRMRNADGCLVFVVVVVVFVFLFTPLF